MITLRQPLRVPAPRLNQVLGAAGLVLAAVAVWPWLVPPLPATRPLVAAPPQTAAPPLATLPPIASYAAIVERPLFSPSRRAPPGVDAAPGPSIGSRYRLLGIVASSAKKTAFLAEGARRFEIAEGDMLDGWKVKAIFQDRVLLVSAEGEAALTMKPASPEPEKPGAQPLPAPNPGLPKPQ